MNRIDLFKKIKSLLKSNALLYKVNSLYKSRLYKRQLHSLRNEYRKKTILVKYLEDSVLRNFKERCAKLDQNAKPHIFWIGANFDQDHTGFMQALKRNSDVTCLIQDNGKYGFINGMAEVEEKALSYNNNLILNAFETANRNKKIDLVFGQMWANYILPETLNEIRQQGVPVVNIAMDDRLPEMWGYYKGYRLGSVGLKEGVDLVLTTVKECVDWYHKEGIPAIYWPLASDKEVFFPAEKKKYDVSFVGNNYGVRAEIVKAILEAGIKVEAFGTGFPNGYVDSTEAPLIFSESKIVLGIGMIGHTRDLITLKLRDFDGPMSGALYITTKSEELCALYEENKEIVLYESIQDLLLKLKFYLNNPIELDKIAKNGRTKAVLMHTWDKRINSILNLIIKA